MSLYESRFRPWLDDPGRWPALNLSAEETAHLSGCLAQGAATASQRLGNLYGEEAAASGALSLVAALAEKVLPETELQSAAQAVAAWDHYTTRQTPDPQVLARGWPKFRSYLLQRLEALLVNNMADALLWRGISARIADHWAPQAELTRALQQEISASGLFEDVAVTLELNPQVAGGGRWVAMQTRSAMAELRRRLSAREACLVELIRTVEEDCPATDVVVAYRLEEELNLGRDGVERLRLWVYDPRRGAEGVSLRLTLAEDRVQAVETPAAARRNSVKAVRPVILDAAIPPGSAGQLPLVSGRLWLIRRLWLLRRAGRQASA